MLHLESHYSVLYHIILWWYFCSF